MVKITLMKRYRENRMRERKKRKRHWQTHWQTCRDILGDPEVTANIY